MIRYPLYRRLGGPQGRSGQVRKILPTPGFDPRNVQLVSKRVSNLYITEYIVVFGVKDIYQIKDDETGRIYIYWYGRHGTEDKLGNVRSALTLPCTRAETAKHLTLSLLMSYIYIYIYIYGAPRKARNLTSNIYMDEIFCWGFCFLNCAFR
jgi:hypothetical protein